MPPGKFRIESGNLEGMKLSNDDRAAFILGYRQSGLSQEEYCRTHTTGISPRTLRSWARLTRRPEEVVARVKAVVAEAIAELTSILAAMEAAGTLAPTPNPDAIADEHDPAAGTCRAAPQDVSHDHGVADTVAPLSPPRRIPMPPPGLMGAW